METISATRRARIVSFMMKATIAAVSATFAAASAASAASEQGLTLVHFSAQRKHILWETLGA
jgi:hypothetical protein